MLGHTAIIKGLALLFLISSGCDFLSAQHSGDFALQSNFQIADQALYNQWQTWNADAAQGNCVSCHNSLARIGGFGSVDDLSQMINQGYIIPGDPANSEYFIRSDDNVNPMPTSGRRPQAELDMVWDFIECGITAPDEVPPPQCG